MTEGNRRGDRETILIKYVLLYMCMLQSWTETDRDITNSISSLGKPSMNEIQQPNNYKKVYLSVFEKNLKIINNLMLRQAWTGGRPVSSICTDRTDFEILKAYRTNVLRVI